MSTALIIASGTIARFCFSARSRTYSHAPPPPMPVGITTFQSSGRSSTEIILNALPSANICLTRLIMLSLFELRLAWIEEPTIMSITSCSVSVRTAGPPDDVVIEHDTSVSGTTRSQDRTILGDIVPPVVLLHHKTA